MCVCDRWKAGNGGKMARKNEKKRAKATEKNSLADGLQASKQASKPPISPTSFTILASLFNKKLKFERWRQPDAMVWKGKEKEKKKKAATHTKRTHERAAVEEKRTHTKNWRKHRKNGRMIYVRREKIRGQFGRRGLMRLYLASGQTAFVRVSDGLI